MPSTFLEGSFGLYGKVALVTGGGGALGRAMALALAQAGADVAVADYRVKDAEAVARSIEEVGRRSLALQVDVTQSRSVDEMTNVLIRSFGRIDVLVNSAGVTGHIPAEEMPDEEWDRVIAINLTGTFFCCRSVGRQMIKQRKGSIINIASMSGVIVNKGSNNTHYCASKAGVIMLTKSLAEQWARHNIRVNSISPGYIRSPLSTPIIEEPSFKAFLKTATPMGRPGLPEELMGLAVFLASDASSYMTGSNVLIDGGYTVL